MYGKSEDREDYQRTPRPLAAMARDLPDGHVIPEHSHRRAQLIYGSAGAITVTTPEGTWVAPPQRAVWIPSGVMHSMRTSGEVPMRTLYIEPGARANLPASCTVITVTPLLRELLLAATRLPIDYNPRDREGRIMELLLDEFEPLAVEPLQLPLPREDVLLRVCRRVIDQPELVWTTAEAAKYAHMSERTFARHFVTEVGCTFGRWRQQARLLAAIEMLARGEPIARVSVQLSYDSPSAFSAMFRRCLGTPPSQYFGSCQREAVS
ncbi:AraC family transcriptional regulator [Streptomyces hygroscopicus]|uniref:AraC family transcriptional regulator n=1 Tax=Streptomyces hygroscopicus TaxID=1912 RepID=UPI0007679D00|nr:helix-turn-helix transcriptional regulator [Streptomyces hygroscopicus]